MGLPKETLKHLGKLLREKTGAVYLIPAGLGSAKPCIVSGENGCGDSKPLPPRFLLLLSELDPRRVREREALHRFWKRRTGRATDRDEAGTK